MSRPWQLVIHEPSMRVLLAANAAKRTQVYRIFDQLVSNPLQQGQYQETDTEGRTVQVMVLPSWTITYWTDFFSKEIRIVRIEQSKDLRKRRY